MGLCGLGVRVEVRGFGFNLNEGQLLRVGFKGGGMWGTRCLLRATSHLPTDLEVGFD